MTTQSINGWIDKPLEGFYAHIYSNGHSVKNLFETEEDRIFGMNLLPIAAHACDVSLLMIQVMGTHFHEIVLGRPEDCERMRRFIKRQLETWMKKTGRKEYIPKGIDISIDGIETETELKPRSSTSTVTVSRQASLKRHGATAGDPVTSYSWITT